MLTGSTDVGTDTASASATKTALASIHPTPHLQRTT